MTRRTATDVADRPTAVTPPLEAGDHLSRAEFERRYTAMPNVKKAELIEGVVYMPSPVSREKHATPHFQLITWLGAYQARTPGVDGGDNSTVRLDLDNEPQPDADLRIPAEAGGQSHIDEDDYVAGAPELAAEIAATSASYDLHDKLNAFRRNGVREYIVWRTLDAAIDWFVLIEGRYERLPLDDHLYKSRVFPGLWLDPKALLAGDMGQVLAALERGIASPEHEAFVQRLKAAPPR
jgi:Uma2 family endonuclease